jgi:uncharacterized peroxidase-related enzyme
VHHHGAGLRRILTVKKVGESRQNALVDALVADYREAELSKPDRAMLDYVSKLTKTPCEMVAADVEGLRRQGFEDRAIHDICAITAYFAFVNRMADGLGVELET